MNKIGYQIKAHSCFFVETACVFRLVSSLKLRLLFATGGRYRYVGSLKSTLSTTSELNFDKRISSICGGYQMPLF